MRQAGFAIYPLCILYVVIVCFVFYVHVCNVSHFVSYIRVCNVAHFVWPHVRSFLSDFTLLLATPSRGKGPNHTLLPSVMRCCIFHKLSTSIWTSKEGHSREGECCPQRYRPLFLPRKGKRQTYSRFLVKINSQSLEDTQVGYILQAWWWWRPPWWWCRLSWWRGQPP